MEALNRDVTHNCDLNLLYNRWIDKSTLGKLQQRYWTVKQTMRRRLGRHGDECIVAADSALDAKLELYESVQKTSRDLIKYVRLYSRQIHVLSQEEFELGQFLSEHGSMDKTRAGSMMSSVGQAMCVTSQQRLTLSNPLVRLLQELETFYRRAVSDSLSTIKQMQGARDKYRGALLWMKDISENLDPESSKQLERFRKVQLLVKKTRQSFIKLKVDCLQKIDLLAVSRCNMFSHALVTYQNSLLTFWSRVTDPIVKISENYRGYQYYEFSIIKDLCTPNQFIDCHQVGKEEQENVEIGQDTLEASRHLNEVSHSENLIDINLSTGAIDKTEVLESKNKMDYKAESSGNIINPSLVDLDESCSRDIFTNSISEMNDFSYKELPKPDIDKQLDELIYSDAQNDVLSGLMSQHNREECEAVSTDLLIPHEEGFSKPKSGNIKQKYSMGGGIGDESERLESNCFLPSLLLTKGLNYQAIDSSPTTKKKGMSDWLDLFEELDPLMGTEGEHSLLDNTNSNSRA